MAYAPVPNQLDSMPVKQVSVIYPNPTTGHCKILFTKPLQNALITITDMAGRVVYHVNSSGTEVLFDLSHVKAGMYLIRIKDGNNSIVQKLIKQ
jgi:hypothetical protein